MSRLALDEPEVFSLDCELKLGTEQLLRRVQRHVEPADAGVGRGQKNVVRGADHDGRLRLESLGRRGKGRCSRPEEDQLLKNHMLSRMEDRLTCFSSDDNPSTTDQNQDLNLSKVSAAAWDSSEKVVTAWRELIQIWNWLFVMGRGGSNIVSST